MGDVILSESGIQQLTEFESVMTRLEPYMELRVESPEDKEGFKAVHAARMDVRSARTGVEKSRKALKAEALEFGRKVDSEAKRIKALIEPIETHLIEQENIVKREEERKKKEKEEAEKKLIEDRLNALAAVGSSLHPTAALAMPEGEFEMLLAKVTGEFNAIQEAKEAERKQIEEAKAEIEKQRQELEAEQQRQEKERREIQRIEDEKREQLRIETEKVEAEKRKVEEARLAEEARRRKELEEAEAKAEAKRIEAEQKIKDAEAAEAKRIEDERLEKERLAAEAEAEAIRKDALSDKEKIHDYLESLSSIGAPSVVSKEANDLILELRDTLNDWAKRVAELGAK